MKVAIIGGGAAGFFSAIAVKENHPEAEVTIFEKSNKVLAKVKVSGGGRCNVTNGCSNQKELLAGYPRGAKFLKKAFKIFDNQSTQHWYDERGVKLKTEEDLRVFPATDDSQTIIDCLQDAINKVKINIELHSSINKMTSIEEKLVLDFKGSDSQRFDKVIVASGGSPKLEGFKWLSDLGHKIETPVPSLFTFNMPNESIKNLMGLAVSKATVRVQGTKLSASGPLLITHWGMSGPAVLKLSSFGARDLSNLNYQFNIQVDWSNLSNQEIASNELNKIANSHPAKQIRNIKPFGLPERMWFFLLTKVNMDYDKKWGELGKKGINKLVNILTNDVYEVSGKTTFKEEFVTCGGVSLESVNTSTLESSQCPNLYFAGEVLDIDGITGGFNFQAAWTTGFIAGKLR
ncbi:MAG: NAD(P)/FAD-dependent oxidoreductase [Reichenbachiella sp.]